MDGNEARVWVGHSEEAVISLKCNEKPLEGFQVSKKRLAFRGGPEAALAHLCSIWGLLRDALVPCSGRTTSTQVHLSWRLHCKHRHVWLRSERGSPQDACLLVGQRWWHVSSKDHGDSPQFFLTFQLQRSPHLYQPHHPSLIHLPIHPIAPGPGSQTTPGPQEPPVWGRRT